MIKLYIVRHGSTNWNDENRIQGLTDVELNDRGVKQVKDLSEELNLKEIDLCITSPLKRAIKTAEILTNNEIEVITDKLLVERNFENLEGQKIDYKIMKNLWDYNLNNSSNNVESLKECIFRAKKFLIKLKKEYDNKKILVVSHGSFIKAIHYNLIGYDKNTDFLSFKPSNSSLYIYDLK